MADVVPDGDLEAPAERPVKKRRPKAEGGAPKARRKASDTGEAPVRPKRRAKTAVVAPEEPVVSAPAVAVEPVPVRMPVRMPARTLVAVRRLVPSGALTGLVASRSARVPGLANWMGVRIEARRAPAMPPVPGVTPRIDNHFTDRKAPLVDGTERRAARRQGAERSLVGSIASGFAHLAIVALLVLAVPTPKLGDIASEPATFGLVWDQSVKAPPPPAAPAVEKQEAPKPVEPRAEEALPEPPPPPPEADVAKGAEAETATEAVTPADPPPPPAAVEPAVESAPMQGTVEVRPVPEAPVMAPPVPPAPVAAPPVAEPDKGAPRAESRKAEPERVRGKPVRHPKAAVHRKAEHPVRREERHRKPEPKREVRQQAPVTPAPPVQPAAQRPAAPLPRVWTPTAQPGAQAASPRPNPASQTPSAAPPAESTEPAHINADWASSVTDWLVQHRTYPTDARLRNIQGVVVIRFSVAPDGTVVDVGVVQSSGSRGLDKAAMDMVRGAQLPAFPPDMTQAKQTVTVPIRYGLE
jgi:TonB family protein